MSNYGEQIKKTRTLLGILQKDLTDSGLSRVHICDLENGKSKLVTIKALRLYEKFIYFSLLRNIEIDIDFDKLFNEDSEYFILKECYKEIYYLKGSEVELSSEKLIHTLNRFKNKNLKKTKFFLLSTIAEGFYKLKDYEESYIFYVEALTSLKYDLDLLNIEIFESTLKSFQVVSAKLDKGVDVVKFYEDLILYQRSNKLQVSKYAFYNLALFEKIAQNYESSLTHLDKHIRLYPKMALDEKFDVQIMRAAVLMNVGEYNNALSIYSLLIDTVDASNDPKRLSMVCSNAINFVVKKNIPDQSDFLNLCFEIISKILKDNREIFSNRYNVYSNLGQVLMYVNAYKESMKYFMQAFKEYAKSKLSYKYDYLILLEESFSSFKSNKKLDELVNMFIIVTVEELDNMEKILYYKILSKILFDQNSIDENIIRNLKNIFNTGG